MQNTVRLKKSQLDYFRRLARDNKNEIQAYLLGEVKSPNEVEIVYFIYPNRYHHQSPNTVAWWTVDYEHVKKEAERLNLQIVGFIHSHPEWDAVMSPDDYNVCITDMHRICGIVSIHGRKTRARFWVMDSALESAIEYATSERTQNRPSKNPERRPPESEPPTTG
jgi:proteasome lid subunit RPN8/RPN11